MPCRFYILALLTPILAQSGSPAAISQAWSKLDRELSALERGDSVEWISGRSSVLEQINNLIRQGFDKQSVPLFQRIHKRDDQILQSTLPAIKSDIEWRQLKQDKKSLKTVTERQSLTVKNLETENKKRIDALAESEKQLKQAEEKIATSIKEVERLKKENEALSQELQAIQTSEITKKSPL